MEYKNLQRAGEIADELPRLIEARKILSGSAVVVVKNDDGETTLPLTINMNVANAVNVEINKLKEEIKGL